MATKRNKSVKTQPHVEAGSLPLSDKKPEVISTNSLESCVRTLAFKTKIEPADAELIKLYQRHQSRQIRTSYNLHFENPGSTQADHVAKYRSSHVDSEHLDSWFEQSSVSKGSGYAQSDIETNRKARCFGGKARVARMSRYKKEGEVEKYDKLKAEYLEKRLQPLYSEGEALFSGNRKFSLDLDNNQVVFRTTQKDTAMYFKLSGLSKKQLLLLKKLQFGATNKLIPVSMSIDYHGELRIMYDEVRVANINPAYQFGNPNTKAICKPDIKAEQKAERKAIADAKKLADKLAADPDFKPRRKQKPTINSKRPAFSLASAEALRKIWLEENSDRNKFVPIPGRTLGLDMNPSQIGVYVNDGLKKIEAYSIDLSAFTKKQTDKTSKKTNNRSAKYKKHLRNKHIHELRELGIFVVRQAKHFRVETLCMERLKIKSRSVKTKEKLPQRAVKAINKAVNNDWKRKYFVEALQKEAVRQGISVKEIQAKYSSTIGNVNHPNLVDEIASAAEVVERYSRNTLFPAMPDLDLLAIHWKDDRAKRCENWLEIHALFTRRQKRGRNKWRVKPICKRFASRKSKVELLYLN